MDTFTSTEVVRVYWRSDLQYSHLINLEWNTVVFLFHIFIGPAVICIHCRISAFCSLWNKVTVITWKHYNNSHLFSSFHYEMWLKVMKFILVYGNFFRQISVLSLTKFLATFLNKWKNEDDNYSTVFFGNYFWSISYSCYRRYNYRSHLSIYTALLKRDYGATYGRTSKKLANN